MMARAVTFDFHNTVAHCDGWFHVEVHTLATDVLRWIDRRDSENRAARYGEAARLAYRALRRDVIRTGIEVDALGSVQRVFAQLSIQVDGNLLEEAVDAVMREALADVHPVPGSIEAIRYLASHGVAVGIVSSAAHHSFVEWTLTAFGVRHLITDVTTSASCGIYKSSHEIYAIAVDRLGVTPGHCVHVGDSYEFDVVSANRAGLKTIWYRPATGPVNGALPDAVVDSLEGVGALALELLRR